MIHNIDVDVLSSILKNLHYKENLFYHKIYEFQDHILLELDNFGNFDLLIDEDLVIFNNELEFKEKIEQYLANFSKRRFIARSGYNKVQKFTVENWAKFITEKVRL